MTTTNDPYKQAANAYKDSNTASMSGYEIVAELYQGIIRNVRAAQAAHKAGKLDEMCNQIEKTNRILVALQAHIDREQGGEAAEFLDAFYTGVFGKLSTVQQQDDPQAAFDELLGHIQPVYEIWCRHASGAASAEENQQQDTGSGVEVGV